MCEGERGRRGGQDLQRVHAIESSRFAMQLLLNTAFRTVLPTAGDPVILTLSSQSPSLSLFLNPIRDSPLPVWCPPAHRQLHTHLLRPPLTSPFAHPFLTCIVDTHDRSAGFNKHGDTRHLTHTHVSLLHCCHLHRPRARPIIENYQKTHSPGQVNRRGSQHHGQPVHILLRRK